MSQAIFNDINPATTSGPQLATYLNQFKAAMMSGLSGTSRPAALLAGGMWVDVTNDPTYWSIKIYDGTVDIEAFRLILANGTVSISNSDSSFEIDRFSADTVGPILKLVKRRIATNGQVLSGDIVGEIRAIGRASDATDPVVATMKIVATENQTNTANGVYISWESTPAGQTTAVEHMRLLDGKLGVGTVAPDAVLHAKGATGVKSEYVADSANGAKFTLQKSRQTGTGATQNADTIGVLEALTTDDTSAKSQSAAIEAVAIEAHTTTAKGTKYVVKTATTGAASPTSKLEIGDTIEPKVRVKMVSTELDSQNVATSATIAQLSATKVLVEMTGSTATTIQGINSGSTLTKVITIHNRSSALVTLAHQNGSATAADRMILPGAANVEIVPESSATLIYNATDSRWKLVSQAAASAPVTTVQVKTSGSGTYTPTSSAVKLIKVRMVGGGAGGAGGGSSSATSGSAGNNTTFDSLTAFGGTLGTWGGPGGAGGTTTFSGTGFAIVGGTGGGGDHYSNAALDIGGGGGHGGGSPFSGGGGNGQPGAGGLAAATNSGAGGGGGGAASSGGTQMKGGAGGGAGGYIEAWMAPGSYAWSVAASSSGGSAGTAGGPGGAGASGIIIIEEYY